MKLTIIAFAALSLTSTAAIADNVPEGGNIHTPPGIRPDAIGNGTQNQGVVRLRTVDGDSTRDTFHAINENSTYRRANGGTASVNGGDGFYNAHQAELLNRQALIASLPPVQHPDYTDVFDGLNTEISALRGDMDSAFYAASGAAALAGIDFTQSGPQIGFGVAAVEGYGSVAGKVLVPVGTNAAVSAGVFSGGGLTGGTLSATYAF